MRKIAVFTLLFVFLSATAVSGAEDVDPERLDAALEMVGSLDAGKEVAHIQARMLHEMISVNPALQPFKGVIAQFIDKYGSWEALKGEMARIYAREFTADELRVLTEFYRSDLGKKAMSRSAAIFEEAIFVGQKSLEEHKDELESMIKSRALEIKAEQEAQQEAERKM